MAQMKPFVPKSGASSKYPTWEDVRGQKNSVNFFYFVRMCKIFLVTKENVEIFLRQFSIISRFLY
jgi:hypothetical protein